jgi:hypothetical protein
MHSPWIDPLWFAIACLGGGGVLLSAWLALGAGRRDRMARSAHLVITLLGVIAGTFALVGVAAGQPAAVWGSAAILAGLVALFVVLPSADFAHTVLRIGEAVHSRRARQAAMLGLSVFCPFAALALVWVETDDEIELSADNLAAAQAELAIKPPRPSPYSPLTTDLGRTVRTLLAADADTVPTPARLAAQDRLLARFHLHGVTIQQPQSWDNANCHGFVFAARRYWIGGGEIDGILDDNGYQATTTIRADDLAVYRGADGDVVHTAIVRGLAEHDIILVESKWGLAGRFIHPHDRHPYPGVACTFYRSARLGHTLRGALPMETKQPVPETNMH